MNPVRIKLAGPYLPQLDRGCDTIELAQCLRRAGHDVVPAPTAADAGLPGLVASMFSMDPTQPCDMRITVGPATGLIPEERVVQWLDDGQRPTKKGMVAVTEPGRVTADTAFVPAGVDVPSWKVEGRQRSGLAMLTDDQSMPLPETVQNGFVPAMPVDRRNWYPLFDVWLRPDLDYGLDRYALEYMAGGGIIVAPKGTVDLPESSGVVEFGPSDTVGDAVTHALDRQSMLSGKAATFAQQQHSMDNAAARLVKVARV